MSVSLKLRAVPRFLASIFSGVGTSVRKDGLATYVDLDYSGFNQLNPTQFDQTQAVVAFQDKTSGSWAKASVSDIFATGLPAPTAITLGGVNSIAAVSHKWINSIGTTGLPTQTQPTFPDISGSIAVSQMNGGTSASSDTFWRGDGAWAGIGNWWKIANLQATNDATFPSIQMRMNADCVQLYNPSTGFVHVVPPGSVTANLAAATNSQGAGGSDIHSTSTVTITIASPAVVTWTAHGLHAGDPVYFTTTGALPTGLTASTRYYVASAGLAANSFEVTATRGGSAINTSGTQSGTHTANAGVYLATAPVTNGTGVGDQVWFYYIWGSGPGLNTLNSTWGPTDTNGAGTLGPYLPSGYTHYAPAFPIVWSSNGLQPNWGLGGATNIRVRGNHVYFPNVPFETLIGFPSNTMDLSGIIPPSYTTMDIYADLEMTYAAGGIGGCSLSTSEGAFWNASLYSAATLPAAMDGTINGIYSPDRKVTFTFSHSSGTPNASYAGIGPVGYTFPQ